MRGGKGRVAFASRPVERCSACYTSADPSVQFVEFMMPRVIPVGDDETAILDECEPLLICSWCVDTAARVVRLWSAPGEDADVQRLTTAKEAAHERLSGAQIELERIRQQQRDARQ